MQISKIGLTTKKTVQNNTTEKRLTTNPFGVSFKGNVIQADVFETNNKTGIQNNIYEKSKLFASALVSGINNFNESFKSRMNAIVSFGKKVAKDSLETLERIGNTEVKIDIDGIKDKIFPDRKYEVKNLSKIPVEDLKNMWQDLKDDEAA